MRVINILFEFRKSTHIVHVHISPAVDYYTLYFTDVELILEFGSKAKYNKVHGLRLLKTSKDADVLKATISRQLEELEFAA